MTFNQVLEAVERLPLDDRETLVDVVRRRMIELRRNQIAGDAREARKEFQRGECRAVSVDELMDEITS